MEAIEGLNPPLVPFCAFNCSAVSKLRSCCRGQEMGLAARLLHFIQSALAQRYHFVVHSQSHLGLHNVCVLT